VHGNWPRGPRYSDELEPDAVALVRRSERPVAHTMAASTPRLRSAGFAKSSHFSRRPFWEPAAVLGAGEADLGSPCTKLPFSLPEGGGDPAYLLVETGPCTKLPFSRQEGGTLRGARGPARRRGAPGALIMSEAAPAVGQAREGVGAVS